ARLWNIMVTRDHVRARVEADRGTRGSIPPAGTCALLVLEGSVRVRQGNHALGKIRGGEVLIADPDHGGLAFETEDGVAHWALAIIEERSPGLARAPPHAMRSGVGVHSCAHSATVSR